MGMHTRRVAQEEINSEEWPLGSLWVTPVPLWAIVKMQNGKH